MEEITYRPIGLIRSPFSETEGMPIQPAGARGVKGTIEIAPEFAAGLKDLEGFSHLIVIYHFHRSRGYDLTLTPFLDDRPRGVFATRAPRRPNAIGLSVLRLNSVEGSVLQVEDVDVLDGTPVLDLKPYVPEFDAPRVERIGWLTGKGGKSRRTRADGRFKG